MWQNADATGTELSRPVHPYLVTVGSPPDLWGLREIMLARLLVEPYGIAKIQKRLTHKKMSISGVSTKCICSCPRVKSDVCRGLKFSFKLAETSFFLFRLAM